jgi:sortase A
VSNKVVPIVLGALFLFLGSGLIGWSLYNNFGPDTESQVSAEEAIAELAEEWEDNAYTLETGEVSSVEMSRPLGKGFAIMYIPKLGKDWRAVVVEGTEVDDLKGKIGKFTKSAEPGKVGNFALAAHRLTKGSLFRNLDEVKKGDEVIIETQTHWYVYEIQEKDIVTPKQIEVTFPVPYKWGKKPTQALITLTTCHPWYSSTQRLAVFGELKETRLKQMGPPASLEYLKEL